jgi:hypothetical protein
MYTRPFSLSFLGAIVIAYPTGEVDSRINPFLSYFFTYSLIIFAFLAEVLRNGSFTSCFPSIKGIT